MGGMFHEPDACTLCLHELHGESEQASGLVPDHFQIVFFAGAREGVPPV